MPDIDLTDLLSDPDFAEQLIVMRRRQVIDPITGIATAQSNMVAPKPLGVVIPQADLPIQRGPDQQALPRLIEVHTRFRLRSASTADGRTYLPDFIVWNGDNFYVNRVYDYSKFGRGFVQADCSSQPTIATAPF